MQKGETISLEITEVNNLGCGVGHAPDGRVVFVYGAVAGELARVSIIKVNKSFLVGKCEEILRPSPDRLGEPFCHAPESCGGCVYRHITYESELAAKREFVRQAFVKVGLPDVTVEEVKTTGRVCGYRNKAQYPLGRTREGVRAGFYAAKSHTLIPARECPMQPKLFAAVLDFFCRFATEHRWSVYDEETGKGLLRHLYLRYGEGTDQLMVCPVINGDALPDTDAFLDELLRRFSSVVSVMLNSNKKSTNVVLGDTYRTLFGTPYIEDVLCGKRFRIAPGAFYQVNHDGAELLYGLAAARTGLTGQGTLLDLYCGIGSIGLSMAGLAERLFGIEIVESAVRCAKQNADLNGVANARFFCGDASDASKLLERAEAEAGRIDADAVILDPPRKGSTPELIRWLCLVRRVPRVVYVSCDPTTLARDCVIFRSCGYTVGHATPVDMFPRTGHVETVALLSRETNPLTIEVRMEVETGEVKEHPTYKRIQEYVQEKYGFKVHTAYIAEVKRMVGLDMHKAPNAVEQRKHEYHPCPPEKVEAIKDALRHFGLVSE